MLASCLQAEVFPLKEVLGDVFDPSNLTRQGRKSLKMASEGQRGGVRRRVSSASVTTPPHHLNQCLSVGTVKDSVFPVRCKSQVHSI